MTREEFAMMEMFLAVEKVCIDNYAAWKEQLGIRNAFHQFSANYMQLRSLMRKIEKYQNLQPIHHEYFKLKLINHASLVAGALKAFAHTSDNPDLISHVDSLMSKLTDSANQLQLPMAEETLRLAVENLCGVKAFDVNLLILGELELAIENFQFCSITPQMAREELEKMEEEISEKVLEVKNILRDNLDPQMVGLRWSNKFVYDLYMNARGSHPHYYASLQGTVVDDATHLPVGSAQITIKELNLSRHITPLGHYIFYHLPPGKYHASVQKFGYEDRLIEIIVPEGEGTMFDIELHHT